MDLKEEDILGADIVRHWYYRSKAAALRRSLAGVPVHDILDVGAGSGFFSRQLLAHTAARSALCVDPHYAVERDETVAGKTLRFRRATGTVACDLVLLMDVLEHVADDRGLLRDYADKVPAGSHFLITVPAFAFLWSGHDVFLEHRRRYRLGEIEAVARAAGLQVQAGSYYFGLIFPLAAAVRLLARDRRTPRSSLSRQPPWLDGLLAGVCTAERPLFPWNRLAGLTAFVLARKP